MKPLDPRPSKQVSAYLIVTGVAFLLVFAAHLARVYAEGLHVLGQPVFLGSSLLCLGLTLWAWRLGRRPGNP